MNQWSEHTSHICEVVLILHMERLHMSTMKHENTLRVIISFSFKCFTVWEMKLWGWTEVKNDSKECSGLDTSQAVHSTPPSVLKIVFTVTYSGSLWGQTLYQNVRKHICFELDNNKKKTLNVSPCLCNIIRTCQSHLHQ